MTYIEPTADEFRHAYVACKLRRIGVSLQKALSTPSTRIALRMTAIAQRKKEQQKDGKPADTVGTNLRGQHGHCRHSFIQ